MQMNRGTSRYHGCLSFLEYAGMDPVSGKFFYDSEEIETNTPAVMQRDFMHARWGAPTVKESPVLLGPGQGGVEPTPPTTPPPPHVHTYDDKPDSDGKWRCLECKEIWNK